MVTIWIDRVDGVTQRINPSSRANYEPFTKFDPGGGAAKVTRTIGGKRRRVRLWKLKEPEVVKPDVFRFTAGFNGVAEDDYVSVTYQEWHEDEDEFDAFKDRATKFIDDELRAEWGVKYHKGWADWNGPPNFSSQMVERTGDVEDLLGDFGGEGESEKGDASGFSVNAMAARMIKSGRWFKQSTLEKWSFVVDSDV